MAKQSGLHQLKGKVDGYSYYRQSGVKAGLMRRINDGMSARVKSSEEFANTRLNNSEFGNAADVAKVLASVITPKFRPMFLNFSQAKLTKSVLSLIKQATGDWGQRALAAGDVASVCEAVNMLAKNDFATLCNSFESTAGSTTGLTRAEFTLTEENAQNLAGFGADGVLAKVSVCAIYAGTYSVTEKRYINSLSQVLNVEDFSEPIAEIPTNEYVATDAAAPDITGTQKLMVCLAVIMPYRRINGKDYILQEKCSFKMIPAVVAA
jgi:hypothetical protein